MIMVVFLVLLGTGLTGNSAPPDVYVFAKDSKDVTNIILTCMATGFYPEDIILWIRRNGRVLTKEDGVSSSGVRPYGDETHQRRDSVEIPRSDKSQYTCEIIHEVSGLRVEKFWGETAPPDVYVFVKDSRVETNIILTCMATGFYPEDIILWIRRNGRVLTKEDGLRSSGVQPDKNNTHQRRDEVEIPRSDKSQYTCEVVHEASGVNVTKIWDHSLPENSTALGPIIAAAAVILVVVALAVGLFLFYRRKTNEFLLLRRKFLLLRRSNKNNQPQGNGDANMV